MTLSDEQLRTLYRRSTGPKSRSDCLTTDAIAALALGDSSDDAAIDHLARCSACSAEYQAIREAEPVAPAVASRRLWQPAALAASILIAVGLGVFGLILAAQNRSLTARLQEKVIPPARIVTTTTPEPVANVAIVDLEPAGSTLRGEHASSTKLPPADSYTFVLNTNPGKKYDRYSIEITNADRSSGWSADGLRRSPRETFTLTVPAAFFKSGDYQLRLFGGAEKTPIETYTVTAAR